MEKETSFVFRLNHKLSSLFGVLLLVLVVLNACQPMLNNVDLGWHIAQGRWMVEHRALYRYDLLTYANAHRPVIDEYPLFQVVLYFGWKAGWWGPSLLEGLAYLLIFGSLLRTSKEWRLRESGLYALVLGLVLIYLQIAFRLRPHLITYLGIVVFGTFLLRHRLTTRWTDFWPLALFQIAWVNCHSGFVLGPALMGIFGAEMIARLWWRDKAFPAAASHSWLAALILIVLACFVNPYGWTRFYLPFYQEHLESIRAYVGEMEPLNPVAGALYNGVSLVAVIAIGLMIFFRRGSVSFSFIFLALVFYAEALSVKKSWPVFGLFLPLILLSTGAFSSCTSSVRKLQIWPSVAGYFAVIIALAIAILTRLDGTSDSSLRVLWQQFVHGQTEICTEATGWMKSHTIEGRLFHRCEDGGWLEQEGYDHGEVYTDTGFGKYEDALIHETGLVGDRPALLSRYLAAYHPDFVVMGDFSFQWPAYLRQAGWRLIFYSPNSSVWTRAEVRRDLATVPPDKVQAAFLADLKAHGRPADLLLYGRNLLALNSLGLEDFSYHQLTTLPSELHHAPWYWEAARALCFDAPSFSLQHREQLLQEASQLKDAPTTEFRAYCAEAGGQRAEALRLLSSVPSHQLSSHGAVLLLKIYCKENRPEALSLARRTDCFDLRDGLHWGYLGLCESRIGNVEAAAQAWSKAISYRPDDSLLVSQAREFDKKFPTSMVENSLRKIDKVYGIP